MRREVNMLLEAKVAPSMDTHEAHIPFGEPLTYVVPKVQSASDRLKNTRGNAPHPPKLMRQNAILGMEFPNIAQ